MIEFAPIRIPVIRRLQTLAVSHFVFCFLFFAAVSTLVTVYLTLFTSYWPFTTLYFVYLFFDRNTPESGGRRSTWIRNWRLWKWMSDYFPCTLHKTVDLDPTRNYIFGIHPHGVLCVGSFTHFSTNGSNFDHIFPGFKSYLTMLPFWFKTPFFRDYAMTGGLVPSSKKAIQHIITRPKGGNICCIIPGGAPESLNARPGDVVLILKNRIGFLKMAVTNGVPLVPVFSFGDHALWEQKPNPPGSFIRRFQDSSQKWTQVALPMFHARGIFQYNYGLMPYRRSVHTVVGEPIEIVQRSNPTSEELLQLQELYISRLRDMFEAHKSKYLPDDCKLIIN
uniref:Acyltransferase n=1 Tax=Ciona savignyi TaxID=51511 RepID=H2Z8T5_CIOSA